MLLKYLIYLEVVLSLNNFTKILCNELQKKTYNLKCSSNKSDLGPVRPEACCVAIRPQSKNVVLWLSYLQVSHNLKKLSAYSLVVIFQMAVQWLTWRSTVSIEMCRTPRDVGWYCSISPGVDTA